MKYLPILLLSLYAYTLYAQQSEIRGVVSIHNSEYETGKRKYVTNAQIEDDLDRTNAQITDASGNFKLIYKGVPEKTTVNLIVKKEGLQVVNIDALGAITGQRDTIRISLAAADKIAEYRRQIYKVGKTEAEKNLAAQLKKKGTEIEILQKDAAQNKASIEKLQKEYSDLQSFASKIEEQAQDLSRRYAPINLDDATPLYRESFRLFQQGELDKAIQILRGADLANQASKILDEEQAIAQAQKELNKRESIKTQRKNDLIQALGLKADLHKATFEWDSVLFCLELKVHLDSTDIDNIGTLAYFLAAQNKTQEAIAYYEKALALAPTLESEANILNNLGILYTANQRVQQAEDAYNKALNVYRQLASRNSDAFLPDVAMTLNNLGVFYSANQKLPQAEETFNEALNIRRQLAERDPIAFLPDLAMTLNNLGTFYYSNRKMPQAEKALAESSKIYRQLAEQNSDAFLPDVARLLNNLGNYYRVNQKAPQAEEALNEALSKYRQLAGQNPDAFLPYVASTLNNLGVLFDVNQKMPQAEAAYNEALKIKRTLAEDNPDAFLPDVAMTLNNLGAYYYDIKKMQQAEEVFNEALEIYWQLVNKNPGAFLPYAAGTLNNLGVYYKDNKKLPQAETAYSEALKIRRQLAEQNPVAFLPDLAITLNNLGLFYKTLTNFKQSLVCFSEAFSYREQAILAGELHFFKDWRKVLLNIAEVKDTAEIKKDYALVVKAGQLMAMSCDKLKDLEEEITQYAVSEYGSLSWWALFTKDYALAEKAALRCLELDDTKEFVLTNLGHSQLLQGQYQAAMATYQKLKGKKDNSGKDYKVVLLDDLKTLETEGVSHKSFAKARRMINKW